MSVIRSFGFFVVVALVGVGCAASAEDPGEEHSEEATDRVVAAPHAPEETVDPKMKWLGGRESTNVIDCRNCQKDLNGRALWWTCDYRCN